MQDIMLIYVMCMILVGLLALFDVLLIIRDILRMKREKRHKIK